MTTANAPITSMAAAEGSGRLARLRIGPAPVEACARPADRAMPTGIRDNFIDGSLRDQLETPFQLQIQN